MHGTILIAFLSVTRSGIEPTTSRSRGERSTTEPPHGYNIRIMSIGPCNVHVDAASHVYNEHNAGSPLAPRDLHALLISGYSIPIYTFTLIMYVSNINMHVPII